MNKLKQLTCPNCGAPLNLEYPNQRLIECPYCHQKVTNESHFQENEEELPLYYLPFSLSEEKHMTIFVDLLTRRMKEIERVYHFWGEYEDGHINMPDIRFYCHNEKEVTPDAHDIFDNISNINIIKSYVPVYVYEGNFRATWTAGIQYRYWDTAAFFDLRKDFINGESIGDFIVVGASDKELSDYQLDNNLLRDVQINPSLLIKVQDSPLEQERLLSPSSDSNTVWREQGKNNASYIGKRIAKRESPGSLEGCTVGCELKKVYMVYIPIFKIVYKYKGEYFYYTSYADQIQTVSQPQSDKKYGPTESEIDQLNSYLTNSGISSKTSCFGCLGAIVFFILFGIYMKTSGNSFRLLVYVSLFVTFVSYIFKKTSNNSFTNLKRYIEARDGNAFNAYKKHMIDSGEEFLRLEKWKNIITFDDDTSMYSGSPSSKENEQHYSNGMKFCPNCGKEINADSAFCKYCGTRQ